MEESRLCAACGRPFAWRKKWAAVWDTVRYCSAACRSRRISPLDRRLEEAIRTLLAGRPAEASLCPSEVARVVAPEDWRALMEPVRRAARRLAAGGEIVVTQRGRVVDAATARGAVRLRRP
jgi:hypothetical protein